MRWLLPLTLAFALVPDVALAGPVAAALGAVVSAVKAFAAINIFTGFLVRVAISFGLSMLAIALQKPRKPRQAGIKTEVTQTGGVNPQTFILGRTATAGQLIAPPMSFGQSGKTPRANLVYVVAAGCLPGHSLERVIVNDEYVELEPAPSGDWGRRGGGDLDGKLWVDWRDGSQAAAHPGLLAEFADDPDRPWSVDMVGPGVSYAVFRFLYDRERWSGLPAIRMQILGIPLYDPRRDGSVGGSGAQRWADPGSWAQTTNPIVMVYNILRGITVPGAGVWGGGVAAEDLPLANWFAAMNACDLAVDDGGESEVAQYQAGIEVALDDEPADVIDELLKACSGQIVEMGGVWKVRVGGPGLPVMTLTDRDMLASDEQTLQPFPSLTDTVNALSASYPEPASLWQESEAPPRYSETLEAEDGGRRLTADLRLPAVWSGPQVQRLMTAWLDEERHFRRHGVNLQPGAAVLEPLDAIAWTSARNGYAAKLFEVSEQTDRPTTLIQAVGLRERDPGDYDWEPSQLIEAQAAVVGTTLPAAQDVPGWTVAPWTVKDAGSNDRRPALRCTWDADAADDARGLRIALRLNGAAGDGSEVAVADLRAGEYIVTEVLPDTAYQARARLVVDRPTAWSAWKGATTPDLRILEGDLADATMGAIVDATSDALAVDYEAAQDAVTDAIAAARAAVVADGNPGFELGFDGWRSSSAVSAADLGPAQGAITGGGFESLAGLNPTAYQRRLRLLVPGRKYRIRTRFRVSGASAKVYVGYQAADGDGALVGSNSGRTYPVVNGVIYPASADVIEAQSAIFTLADVQAVGSGDRLGAAGIYLLALLNYDATPGAQVWLDGIWLEDVTEGERAAASASAAYDSEQAAFTHAGTAEGYAAAAEAFSNVAARVTGGGMSPNPTFNLWSGTYPDGLTVGNTSGANTLTKLTSGVRYRNAVKVSAKNSGANGPSVSLSSTDAGVSGNPSPAQVRIRAEFELLSDVAATGASLRVSWNGSPNRHIFLRLDQFLENVTGRVQVVDLVLERPSDADLATPSSFQVLVWGHTSTLGGADPRKDCEFVLHRLDYEEVLAGSFSSIVQQAVARQDGWAASVLALRTQAGSGGAKLELVALSDPEGDSSIARLAADDILLEGSVTVPYLTVDGLLQLSDSGAFSAFKAGPEDSSDGLFVGKAPDGGGGQRFAFSASREADGKVQAVSLTNDGFVLENPAFRVASGAMEAEIIKTANMAVTDLRASGGVMPTAFALTQAIGGGGGGAGESGGSVVAGLDGDDTVVEIYDGATLKMTWTASGGNGGSRGGSNAKMAGQSSGVSGYGTGGNGGSWRDSEDRDLRGEGGSAGKVITAAPIDLTGYSNPRIKITIGAGGAGGGNGLAGLAGRVKYRVQKAASLEADVIPLKPRTTGSFAKVNNTAGNLPDLGPGLWTIWRIDGVMQLEQIDLGDGTKVNAWNNKAFTFVASGRPSYAASAGTWDIYFAHYPMGGKL